MVGKGSSSKRKSSKKKSAKISSQVLKKKSRRKESKKRRRPRDFDDVSFHSDRTSSSTSISDYRSEKNKSKKLHRRDHSVSSYSDDKKSTSSSPIALKHKKKRARKRSIHPDKDSDSRKRKRLSRDRVLKTRKKSLKKKKSKKHLTSSSSSDSDSGSTSPSESSFSTDDGKRKRKRVILDKEIKRPGSRDLHKAHRKRKLRSPSYSSSSSDHEIGFNHSDEALVAVDNSRRLKSVIVIADQTREETEIKWAKDPNKEEEIVYDRGDYPSPKSLDDSDEGVSKKESDNHSQGAYSKGIRDENVEFSEMNEPTKGSEREEETGASVTAALYGNDLESILRQKALENLKKFRGGIQTSQRTTNVNIKSEDFKEPSTTRAAGFSSREMDGISGPTYEVKKDLDGENIKKVESVIVKQTATLPLEGAEVCSEREKYPSAVFTKPVSSSDNTNHDTTVSEEHSLKEQQNETKDSSEFEQKTMSVMRAGEMVQVSYKVYIPKRAPALARRQLRR